MAPAGLLVLQDVVFGQRKVAGSIVGGRADMMSMLEFAAAKGIKPMVEIMRLDQVRRKGRVEGVKG